MQDYRKTQSHIEYPWPTGTDILGPGSKGRLADSVGI